jgi:hypothetical protein
LSESGMSRRILSNLLSIETPRGGKSLWYNTPIRTKGQGFAQMFFKKGLVACPF